ncbi:hypothetical protein CYMTET_31006, partial [Cymbomonas tetramitiformis]
MRRADVEAECSVEHLQRRSVEYLAWTFVALALMRVEKQEPLDSGDVAGGASGVDRGALGCRGMWQEYHQRMQQRSRMDAEMFLGDLRARMVTKETQLGRENDGLEPSSLSSAARSERKGHALNVLRSSVHKMRTLGKVRKNMSSKGGGEKKE